MGYLEGLFQHGASQCDGFPCPHRHGVPRKIKVTEVLEESVQKLLWKKKSMKSKLLKSWRITSNSSLRIKYCN